MSPIAVGCVYRECWDDGLGARGWKLAHTLADPNIIASTPVTGERIPTSVLVHDLLDHALCGLPPSGHRAEAVALTQLAERNGADPTPDLLQMIDEDLMQGRADGEPLWSLLPGDLRLRLPAGLVDGAAIIAHLRQALGAEVVRERLLDQLRELGRSAADQARRCYRANGLDPAVRGVLGLAMQRAFEQADHQALGEGWVVARSNIIVEGSSCRFDLVKAEPDRLSR